jgi:hypothetical protein
MARSAADLRAALANAYDAQAKALQASNYGAEGVNVARDLKQINATIDSLESQLAIAEATEAGNSAITFLPAWGGL